MNRRRFEALVRRAILGLPREIRRHMDNVAVVVEDWPDREHLAEAGFDDPYELFALYQGIPLTRREGYNMALPDKITIFQGPIEAACAGERQMVSEVRITVAHEVAHHFGLSDEELERMGLG